MTEELFRNDAYATTCQAIVSSVTDGAVVLDQTVFYPTGGGQPGDQGHLKLADGREIEIVDSYKDRETGQHLHIAAEGSELPAPGDQVTAEINWPRRHRFMRMHTCLHLMLGVIDGQINGAQIGEAKSRIDFDLPDTSLDKEAISAELNRLVEEDHAVGFSTISDEELAANPDLVRTMSVAPPSGMGRVRVIEVEGVDLQPCGGTHVKSTKEIGRVRVGKIENKGKHNRRINVHLEE